MKSLINNKGGWNKFKREYKYFPKTGEELIKLVRQRIKDEGNECDLNDINVSNIDDLSYTFDNFQEFNGNVSKWDVSNAINMEGMFSKCKNFNCDISQWDTRNVENMDRMFVGCLAFNQNISEWDTRNVTDMEGMFWYCKNFYQDLSGWNVDNVKLHAFFCTNSSLSKKNSWKPKFKV